MERYRPRKLTIGDGFRIGFGIGFWLIAWTVMLWVALIVPLGILAAMTG